MSDEMVSRFCCAQPYKGDGSVACDLTEFHDGLHAYIIDGRHHYFRRVEPGSSPRSPWRTRKRVAGRSR